MRTRPENKFHLLLLALLLGPSIFFFYSPPTFALGCDAEVNTTDDNPVNYDGICDVSHCSLREAIQWVNSDPNDLVNAVCFNLGGNYPTIILSGPLPDLSTSMSIHSPNLPDPTWKVVINGANVGGTGLKVTNGNITLHNLVIQGFDIGVEVRDKGKLRLGSSHIGTNGPGDGAAPNRIGVALFNSGNAVGKSFVSGNQLTGGNVISGNTEHGILIEGPGAANNFITENLIGTNGSGTGGLANGGNGIQILDAQNNHIVDNIVSGNGGSGIFLGEFSDENEITGNHVGLGKNGTPNLGNGAHGIYVLNGESNWIGGPTPGDGNVIGENVRNGIYLRGEAVNNTVVQGNRIGTDPGGQNDRGNHQNGIEILQAENNQIGGTQPGEPNIISGNDQDGIIIGGDVADGNKVIGNLIGLKADGDGPLGNSRDGIRLSRVIQHPDTGIQDGGPSQNIIAKNIISSNGETGITLEGKNTSLNNIFGNFIGTDKTGTQARGNGAQGIHITVGEAPEDSLPKPGPPLNNTIGNIEGVSPEGPCTGGCNLISGNEGDGIRIDGAEVSGNRVVANFIGMDASGTQGLANGAHGVVIAGAHKNNIGDYPVQKGQPNPNRNLISGNQGAGVHLFGGLAKNNRIFGNFIGTDTTGNSSLGNSSGIWVEFSNGNFLGDAAEGAGNLISGNKGPGIEIDDSHNTLVQNNKIGLDGHGTNPLPNQGHGIHILNASTANSIGGENSGQGNEIAFNAGDGVHVSGLRNIEIVGNSIHDNSLMGIDLEPDGINANDAGDVDEGVNESQNFPELTSVVPRDFEIEVQGTLSGLPNRQYRIHFYSNESCNGDGHGQGQYYLGVGLVETDETGTAQFAALMPGVGGEMITATATDDSRNTSEFSACRRVGTGPGVDFDLDGILNPNDNCPNDSNRDQTDGDGDQVGDVCDICPDMDDRADLDFNQVPDCLELFVRGAGTACTLNPLTSRNTAGTSILALEIILILLKRKLTTVKLL